NSTSGALGPRTFTATYRDLHGASDITDARILISPNGSGTNALYARYDGTAKKLYLMNTAGNGWMGGYAPGSNNVIINSQGRLNCAATTVSPVGNTLTINWSFTPTASFTGTKRLYLFVRDTSGLQDGWDHLGIWNITSGPSNVSVSPNSGSSLAGAARTLTATYVDPTGATDITDARILISSDGNGTNALYARYDRSANRLYLMNNNASGFLGGYAPGSNNVIINSQGRLNCATTTVSPVDNTLTINWNFTPTASFTGTKYIFLYVRDAGGLTDGWDMLGLWNITSSSSPIAAMASGDTSPVQLSSAMASASRQSVTLSFTGALDAATAEDGARYVVEVNGFAVAASATRYDARSQSVTLSLPEGGLQVGDNVTVTWDGGTVHLTAK
ncbi:MAG: hypothetical protein M3347_18765, partial [Armatimonadota bacterium]|nr:hypothetical protein [Armatimonadota bacterium]